MLDSDIPKAGLQRIIEAQEHAMFVSGALLTKLAIFYLLIVDQKEQGASCRNSLRQILRWADFSVRSKKTGLREHDFAVGLVRHMGLVIANNDAADLAETLEEIDSYVQLDLKGLVGALGHRIQQRLAQLAASRQVLDAHDAFNTFGFDLTGFAEAAIPAVNLYAENIEQMKSLGINKLVFVPPLSCADMIKSANSQSKTTGIKFSLTKALKTDPDYHKAAPSWQIYGVREGTPINVYREQLIHNVIAYERFIDSDHLPENTRRFMQILFGLTTNSTWRFLLDEFTAPLQTMEDPRVYLAFMMQQCEGKLPAPRHTFVLNPTDLKKGDADSIIFGTYLPNEKKPGGEIGIGKLSDPKKTLANPRLLWGKKLA